MVFDAYFSIVGKQLENVLNSQKNAMEQTALLLADTAASQHAIYIFGCSHSSIMAQEVFYRAGGLALVNPIFAPGMTLEAPPATRTTKFERISGIAEAVLSETPIRAGDALIICSISGRNVVPIEMAEYARKHGIRTVAVTALAYANSVASRHPSGYKLHELADIVLDCCSEPGDAVLELPGLPVKTAPTSTIACVAMLHPIMARTIELLIQRGYTAPVFLSANMDDGDAHNRALLEQYQSVIHYAR